MGDQVQFFSTKLVKEFLCVMLKQRDKLLCKSSLFAAWQEDLPSMKNTQTNVDRRVHLLLALKFIFIMRKWEKVGKVFSSYYQTSEALKGLEYV